MSKLVVDLLVQLASPQLNEIAKECLLILKPPYCRVAE